VVALTRFILVTFFFLAVAFYEMSGGAGFVPEQRIAAVEPVETVTRADTVTLASLTQVQEPAVPEALAEPLIAPIVAELPVADAAVVDAVVAEVTAAAVAPPVAEAPVLDLRQVIPELVNVREGPGTDYAVMDKLPQGTQTEVLETDAAGWARVRVIDSGLLGWVSVEFLGASNG
jgi:uncharacterized protein YgiM (DUF1202 family)